MEANRLNIAVEKPPMVIMTNSGFAQELEIGHKGQADVEFEVLGLRIEPDENGNEVIKYTLRIIKATKFNPKKGRQ